MEKFSLLNRTASALLMVFFFVLFASSSDWAWGQKLPFKIVDRFGTEYNLNDIVRPPDRAAFDCDGNSDGISEGGHFNFQLDFLDAAGQGFNDPAKLAYKTVICQVLTDLSYLLDAHPNCAGNKPLLRIEIRPAVYEAPTPNGTLLGAASTYYYNYTNGSQMQTGYAYGNVWRTLNGGEDNTSMPYLIGTNTYHGYMYFNFHSSITWNTAMDPNFSNGAAGKDFYQVVLHETCHMLGIHSWIDSDGTSRVSNPASDPNGLYTAYDKFLIKQSPPNTAVLHNTDGCHAVQFNTTTNLLTGGCDQINFKGTQTPTLSLPAYTPTVWADGSSLSHFGNDPCNTTPYLMHWSIMNDAAGHAIHRPTNDELTVLCEIGYRVTNTYGSPSSPFLATVPSCGHIAAGVDDSKPNLDASNAPSCVEPLYKFCSFPVTISMSDLLANDVGVSVAYFIDEPCITVLQGNIVWSQTGTGDIIITNASYGLNAFSYTPIDAVTQQPLNATVVYFEGYTCVENCNPANALPCNLLCNSHLNPPTPSCIGAMTINCTTVEGWIPGGQSPDYWITQTADGFSEPNIVPDTPYNINPPTPGCIGLAVGASFTLPGSEIVALPTNIVSGQSYLYSSYRMYPNWPNMTGTLQMRAILNNTSGFFIPGSQTILDESNIPNDGTWRQTITCFTATQDYSRLFIKPYGSSAKYLFVDETYISPDVFPQPDTYLSASTCGEQFNLGGACTAIPNVLFKWEMSLNGGAFNIIPGATQGTYTTPQFTGTNVALYRLTRYLNPTPAHPISNAAAAAACINKTAVFHISYPDQACCIANADPTFLQFNANNQVVPYNTGGTPNYTAPAVTATITPTSANNPFGAGVGTAANPARINGDITIPAGATITFDGMNFEFGINGRIKVATNGRLIITNNSTLRGNPLCQTMWQGIRVQGPGENLKRLTTGGIRNYGIVELTGNVNIEDAIIGAAGMYTPLIPPNALLSQVNQAQDLNTLSTLIMPAYTSNNTAHQTAGGVVRVNGHVINFTNCFQGVNLSWYRYNGGIAAPSWVHQGNFAATRTLWYPFSQLPTAAGTITEVGVVLNYYNSIDINLSRFTNTLYGIRAFGAYQATFGNDNIFERTNFVDKDMVGISVFNFENSPVTESDVTITDNDFNNLTIGMQCAGTDLSITQNRINATTGTSYAGALLYGCTYTAKNNDIRSCYTGIASQADQNIPNLIKANTFDYCIVGTWARGDDTGLQIVCNDFDHYATGIAMSNATLVAPEPGKLDDQGSCFEADKNPADNLFLTGTNPPIFPDLLSNTTDSYIYYYRTGTDYQPSASANLQPQLCSTGEGRSENCADFVLAANDVINIIEGTTQDQEMIKTIRRLVQVDHDTTAAVNLLATVNSRAAKRMALEYYIKKAMFNAAQQLLNSLPTTTQDDQFFKQLSTIKRDLAQSNRSIFELTTAEIATITNIANYRTRTSFEAQAILYLVQQREFPVQMEHLPAPLPAYTGTLPVVHFKNDAANTHLANAIKVLPNPTRDFVTVELPTTYSNATLSIYTIEGKLVLSQTLSTGTNTAYLQQIPTGLYYYLIETGNSLLQRDKLLIVK